MMVMTALQCAVRKAGSQSSFAEAIGVSQQIVSYWLSRGRPLPAEFVLAAEAHFAVPRHELRPDLYPPEPDPPAGYPLAGGAAA